jgi:hypothetical protein
MLRKTFFDNQAFIKFSTLAPPGHADTDHSDDAEF